MVNIPFLVGNIQFCICGAALALMKNKSATKIWLTWEKAVNLLLVCVCVAAWNELQQQVKINFYTVSRNSVRYSIIRNVL